MINDILLCNCHVYVYHIFIIHLLIGRYLDCFHFLPIVNEETINIDEYLCSRMSRPLGICQELVWQFEHKVFIGSGLWTLGMQLVVLSGRFSWCSLTGGTAFLGAGLKIKGPYLHPVCSLCFMLATLLCRLLMSCHPTTMHSYFLEPEVNLNRCFNKLTWLWRQLISILVVPLTTSSPAVFVSCFVTFAILARIRGKLKVVLICIDY